MQVSTSAGQPVPLPQLGPLRAGGERFAGQPSPFLGARYENVPSSVYFSYAPAAAGLVNGLAADGSCPTQFSTLNNGARAPMYVPQRPLIENYPTIVQLLQGQARFSKMATLLGLAPRFLAEIREGGPYTIFVPTNEALGRMPNGALEWLIANPPMLLRFIQTHVVRGMAIFAEDLHDEDRFVALDGTVHYITQDASGNLEIDEAARLFEAKKDEIASTGIVHGIGNVLLPAGMAWPSGLPRCKNNCVEMNRPPAVMPLCVRRCVEGYNDY